MEGGSNGNCKDRQENQVGNNGIMEQWKGGENNFPQDEQVLSLFHHSNIPSFPAYK
jgi:hypothetical protein